MYFSYFYTHGAAENRLRRRRIVWRGGELTARAEIFWWGGGGASAMAENLAELILCLFVFLERHEVKEPGKQNKMLIPIFNDNYFCR